jgi:hypothetical protein
MKSLKSVAKMVEKNGGSVHYTLHSAMEFLWM